MSAAVVLRIDGERKKTPPATSTAQGHEDNGETQAAESLRDDASRFAETKSIAPSIVEAFGATPA